MRFTGLAVCAIAALGACACARTSSGAASAARASVAAALERNPASASDGAAVYTTNCSSCHQANGRGLPGAFPPLAGNPFVTGDPRQVIRVVKFGQSGKIAVGGVAYDGTMPRWSRLISDREIAAVVTYIRVSWNNKAGAVSLADVRAVK